MRLRLLLGMPLFLPLPLLGFLLSALRLRLGVGGLIDGGMVQHERRARGREAASSPSPCIAVVLIVKHVHAVSVCSVVSPRVCVCDDHWIRRGLWLWLRLWLWLWLWLCLGD